MEMFVAKSEEDSRRFGRELAAGLGPGSVLALTGDLGAGKTTLTKAIAEGLGVAELVVSPTFTIIHEYRSGRLPLYHFDLYRISEEEELYEMGYEDYFFGDGVCVVEWADLFPELFPPDTVWIEIGYGEDFLSRIYRMRP